MATKNSASTATTQDLELQLTALKKDISELTSIVGRMGQSKVTQLKSAAAAQVSDVKEKGVESKDAIVAQAEELGTKANDFVVKQPATALAIAAGVGFLMGFMSSKK